MVGGHQLRRGFKVAFESPSCTSGTPLGTSHRASSSSKAELPWCIGDPHNDPQFARRIAARLPSVKCGLRAQREQVRDDFTTDMTNVPPESPLVMPRNSGAVYVGRKFRRARTGPSSRRMIRPIKSRLSLKRGAANHVGLSAKSLTSTKHGSESHPGHQVESATVAWQLTRPRTGK